MKRSRYILACTAEVKTAEISAYYYYWIAGFKFQLSAAAVARLLEMHRAQTAAAVQLPYTANATKFC